MRRNLQMYYGIRQENWYNRILTEGWDAAQSRVRVTLILDLFIVRMTRVSANTTVLCVAEMLLR